MQISQGFNAQGTLYKKAEAWAQSINDEGFVLPTEETDQIELFKDFRAARREFARANSNENGLANESLDTEQMEALGLKIGPHGYFRFEENYRGEPRPVKPFNPPTDLSDSTLDQIHPAAL